MHSRHAILKFLKESESDHFSGFKSETLAQLKADDEPTKDVYFAIANTPALDRDDEVVLPKGVALDNFLANPVMLAIHNYRHVSVGRVLKLSVSDDEIAFAFRFSPTDEGQELKLLYDTGMMSAFSVGFLVEPGGYVPVGSDDIKELKVEVRGEEVKLDLTKYSRPVRGVITAWELLEISPVPVPSNPEALLRRGVEEAIRKQYGDNPTMAAFAKSVLDDRMSGILKTLSDFTGELDEFEVAGTVARHSTPIDMDAAWDGQAARASLARWASSDGTGAKETIDWSKYARGFAWFDAEKVDAFTSYKLPHHIVRDGQLVAVWRGITSAMSSLLGARGGTDLGGDEREVYAHLLKHYEDAGREAPDFEREFDDADLKAIAEDTWEAKATRSTGAGGDDGHTHTYDDARSGRTSETEGHSHEYDPESEFTGPGGEDGHRHSLGESSDSDENAHDGGSEASVDLAPLLTRLSELDEGVNIRLGILGATIEELAEAVSDLKERLPAVDDGSNSGQDTDRSDGQNDEGAYEGALERGAARLASIMSDRNAA